MLFQRRVYLTILYISLNLFFFLPIFTIAQQGNIVFNIDPSYDSFGRDNVEAILTRSGSGLYFYVETEWWGKLTPKEQNDAKIAFYELDREFKDRIYPTLTSVFGSEPKPGIDRDDKITILVHRMKDNSGGYTNSGDVYSKFQVPRSNEREMIYLNAKYITTPYAKSFLAHEFTHLIGINQKNLLRKVEEEIWLEEARAEYAPTLLGYDNNFSGSNLEKRVRDFLENPRTSLTAWNNSKFDYAAVNLFAQYLVDQYGIKILVDSLQSSKIGIHSLQE
ncbi:MAG: hypothetical protein QXO70_03385, partial [Candidatus Pacearchaeota archaeon]